MFRFAALLKLLIAAAVLLTAQSVSGQDALKVISTRDKEKISYWWMPRQNATATVILLSGGGGGMGLSNGVPMSTNFLVRSRDHFANEGFNVAILGNPSDKRSLDEAWRASKEHMADVANVIADIKTMSPVPVWTVGTSMGSISAAAVGIHLQDKVAGIILTSSVVSFSMQNSVPQQKLEEIRIPVLVYHHQEDSCRATLPVETGWIMRNLKNAPVKKRMLVSGGKDPSGDPCEPFHWHGFIGMEEQAVKDIAGWIRNPQP